ncbi:MAG: aldo/keto reductase [Coriobacteriia bacterium]
MPNIIECMLGLGGFHIGKLEDPDLAVEIVRSAIDSGFRLLDNSWDYHDGESERRIGRAIADSRYRQRVWVMTKADSRSYDGLMRQFEESLSRLGLDRIDLLQLHEVIRESDAEDASQRGALRALGELREEGIATHIGITGHKDPDFLIAMAERAAAEGIRLDTVQMPVNAADPNTESFTKKALPRCRELGLAVIGMKPLGGGAFLESGDLHAADLLRWSMSQPIDYLVTGCESLRQVRQATEIRDTATPFTAEECDALAARAGELLAEGRIAEAYKTTLQHDATTKHPEWLE